jgi:ADP-ribosyl-[dinitrogen reductase] hydrolase
LAVVKTQHAIGALVGSAVGDALGAPFEFKQPGLYRKTYPVAALTGIGEMRGGGGFGWKPAEFTDDTQMALALAESLIARNGFDPDDLWQRLGLRLCSDPGPSPEAARPARTRGSGRRAGGGTGTGARGVSDLCGESGRRR